MTSSENSKTDGNPISLVEFGRVPSKRLLPTNYCVILTSRKLSGVHRSTPETSDVTCTMPPYALERSTGLVIHLSLSTCGVETRFDEFDKKKCEANYNPSFLLAELRLFHHEIF